MRIAMHLVFEMVVVVLLATAALPAFAGVSAAIPKEGQDAPDEAYLLAQCTPLFGSGDYRITLQKQGKRRPIELAMSCPRLPDDFRAKLNSRYDSLYREISFAKRGKKWGCHNWHERNPYVGPGLFRKDIFRPTDGFVSQYAVLVLARVEPGDYTLCKWVASGGGFTIDAPLKKDLNFSVHPGEVVYLGSLELHEDDMGYSYDPTEWEMEAKRDDDIWLFPKKKLPMPTFQAKLVNNLSAVLAVMEAIQPGARTALGDLVVKAGYVAGLAGFDSFFDSFQAERKWPDYGLLRAAREGETAAVQEMLEKGAEVNTKDGWGDTPFHEAASNGRKETCEVLLEKGAEVNTKNEYGNTPLLDAASQGNREICELLLAEGAEVNSKDNDGETPLHVAAGRGKAGICELLLAKGADVNAKDNYGLTPLHGAALFGHRETCELLLAKGADVNAKDNYGLTPLLRAAAGLKREVCELLLAKGAEVNAKNNDGETPLYMAASRHYYAGARETCELLLAKGAEVNARDNNNQTPLAIVQKQRKAGGDELSRETSESKKKELRELIAAAEATIEFLRQQGGTE